MTKRESDTEEADRKKREGGTERDAEGKRESLHEDALLYQEELRAHGWQFDLADVDQPLRRYDVASGEMGERASASNVVENTDEYIQLKAMIHRYLAKFMINVVGLESTALPLDKDCNAEHNPKLRSEIWMSKDALKKDTVLVLINGMTFSEVPAWNMKACVYHGLKAGGIVPYISRARERDWGIVICNPNRNAVICDAGDADIGPAPPHIIQGIADFGFGEIAAHRGCLGSKSTNLERCGNWIYSHMGKRELLNQELSEAEKRLRILPIPYNEDPAAHVQYVGASKVHFVPFSYGGFAVTKLVEGKIGMADSSHFIDILGDLSPNTVKVLKSSAKNWIPSAEPPGTDLDGERLHVRSVSAGAVEHGVVAGLCAGAILDFLERKAEPPSG